MSEGGAGEAKPFFVIEAEVINATGGGKALKTLKDKSAGVGITLQLSQKKTLAQWHGAGHPGIRIVDIKEGSGGSGGGSVASSDATPSDSDDATLLELSREVYVQMLKIWAKPPVESDHDGGESGSSSSAAAAAADEKKKDHDTIRRERKRQWESIFSAFEETIIATYLKVS